MPEVCEFMLSFRFPSRVVFNVRFLSLNTNGKKKLLWHYNICFARGLTLNYNETMFVGKYYDYKTEAASLLQVKLNSSIEDTYTHKTCFTFSKKSACNLNSFLFVVVLPFRDIDMQEYPMTFIHDYVKLFRLSLTFECLGWLVHLGQRTTLRYLRKKERHLLLNNFTFSYSCLEPPPLALTLHPPSILERMDDSFIATYSDT
uniref:Uncharacterized protein n=1 Tax=Glossina palpalis gambiensis TaxID=67801 RepID=A0A1B0B4C8_9MUSC